jgi:hypothetical protein
MITCPWCGTNYADHRPSCKNCGGSLPLPQESPSTPAQQATPARPISVPPPAPRAVPRNYAWRVLFTDGWAIAGVIFAFIGSIFAFVGIGLTLGIVTALVGLPFAVLGLLFLAGGGSLLIWRYGQAKATVELLREGDAALGEIVEVYQNYMVQVNGRHPWTLTYRFEVEGQEYDGKVTTLTRPDLRQQPGVAAYVLYARDDPGQSTMYPHPYGYHSV